MKLTYFIIYTSVGALQIEASLIEIGMSGILKVKWKFTCNVLTKVEGRWVVIIKWKGEVH